ncbi:MAG TPA: serine/threonine-protein kinase, partial [Longimicrobium sp.]|jgi:serine/threonine-protein kinase
MTTLAGLLQGRLLADRYRIGVALGFGGMGAVFRAHDERLGRDVAVKVLTAASTDPAEQEVLRARFRREARAAAALRHPNVVTVHDFGTDAGGGLDYLVMELLPGRDVAARLAEARGPLLPEEVLEVVREAAMGLAAGHRAGLVHRDVKPRNLFLVADPAGGWEVKVLDFGIAQLAAGDTPETRLTQMRPSPHTPRYAAPEQLAGAPQLSAACDVYALGMVALEMLAGSYVEGLNTDPGDAVAIRAVDSLRPRVPAAVCDALLAMLRRDPTQRPADADAVLRLLGPAARDPSATVAFPPSAAPTSAATMAFPAPPAPALAFTSAAPPVAPAQPPAAPPQAEPRRGSRAGWVMALVALTLVAAFWSRGGDEEPPPAPVPVREQAAVQPEPPPIPPEVAAAREIANQEAFRAVKLRGGIPFGEKLWIIVAGTRPPAEVVSAAALRDRLREAGHPAGLANDLVYPELPKAAVAVVAGPYDREAAQKSLPRIRRVARGAALREVSFQVPR